MKVKENFESIIENLSVLRYIIQYNSKRGHTDINNYAENFYMEILNKVYDWELKNLNSTKFNHPGIDLGDKKKKIAVQITSTSSKAKIDHTLSKIKEHKLENHYDTLYILIITEKKNHEIEDGHTIKFDTTKNLIDTNDLLADIESLGHNKIEEISKFISQQTDYVKKSTAINGSIFFNSASFHGVKHQNLKKIYNYYEIVDLPIEDIQETLLPSISKLYECLGGLSQSFRKAFLFLILKSVEGKMGTNNWASMIENDLGLSRQNASSVVDELEKNKLAFDDEDQPSQLNLYDEEFWFTIEDMIDKNFLKEDEIYELVVNRNFSVLDQ